MSRTSLRVFRVFGIPIYRSPLDSSATFSYPPAATVEYVLADSGTEAVRLVREAYPDKEWDYIKADGVPMKRGLLRFDKEVED